MNIHAFLSRSVEFQSVFIVEVVHFTIEALHHHVMAAMTGGRNYTQGNYTLSRGNDFSPDSIVPASCHGCHHVMVQSIYTVGTCGYLDTG